MKYVSIDIETCGLDPQNCDIIEFAAVVDDLNNQAPLDSLPKFQTYIHKDFYRGEPYALSMHAEIFKKISKYKENNIVICKPENLMPFFSSFLTTIGGYKPPVTINVAGKNFAGFDNKFLSLLPNYNAVKMHHRFLDPAMLFFNPTTDETVPSTAECLRRAGMDDFVSHTALDDALAVVKLLRSKFPQQLKCVGVEEGVLAS